MAGPDSSLTPEQRLLKIIEAGGDPSSAPHVSAEGEQDVSEEPKKKREPIDWKELLSPEGLRARFEYFRETLQNRAQEQSSAITVKTVNQFLIAGCVFFGLFIIGNGTFEMNTVSRDFLSRFDLSQKKMADVLMGNTHDASQLFANGAPRNVFAPYVESTETKTEAASDLALKLMEMVKTLKLTGISYFDGDESRTFCMIEDIQKNITTFLKKGESFSGLTVKEIKPDSVVLSLGNEELEIR